MSTHRFSARPAAEPASFSAEPIPPESFTALPSTSLPGMTADGLKAHQELLRLAYEQARAKHASRPGFDRLHDHLN